ncbi:hypothetical protein IAR50_006297 [Cryptococcus sp. DSM 104548]
MWLILARHGQTEDNVRGIIQGHKDTPLNDWGRFESTRLAEALQHVPITEAYTSPLSRASETAEIALKPHPHITLYAHPGLKERGLGSMEGRKRGPKERAPADAESYQSLSRRSMLWFDSLLGTHIPNPPPPPGTPQDSDTILIISHGAWLSNFLHLLLSPSHYKFIPDKHCNLKAPCLNTSVTVVYCEYDYGKKRWEGWVKDWADVSHLRDVHGEEVVGVADDVR